MRANCCICSDIFDEVHPISATSCGHVYHTNCLMSWVGQCKTCPICRTRINTENVLRLYFNFLTTSVVNSSILENEVSSLKAQLSAKDIELQECKKKKEDTRAFVRAAEKRAADLQQTVFECESKIADLRLKVKSTMKLEAKILKLEQMNTVLTNDLQTLSNVQSIVNGAKKDVENILQQYGNVSESSKQMATYCSVLKRELEKVIDSKTKLLELSTKLKQENCRFVAKVKFYEDAMARSKNNSLIEKNSKTLKTSNFEEVNATSSATDSILSNSVRSSDPECVNTSPLSVPFNNLKFNMCIVAPSKVPKKSERSTEVEKYANGISSFTQKQKTDDSSIVRTGYNGFGGHSNFINTSGFKKMRSLKRKI